VSSSVITREPLPQELADALAKASRYGYRWPPPLMYSSLLRPYTPPKPPKPPTTEIVRTEPSDAPVAVAAAPEAVEDKEPEPRGTRLKTWIALSARAIPQGRAVCWLTTHQPARRVLLGADRGGGANGGGNYE
jgi:hypothetical protein